MIDIKLIRENPEKVQKAAKNKNIDIDVNHILEIDKKHKELLLSVQKLHEERNIAAKNKDIEKGKELKEKLEKKDHALKAVGEELKEWLFKIPNIPLETVPIGDVSKNEIIKIVGRRSKFDFTPLDHLEIGERLDIIDVKRASKVSGTRFAYLKNEGALLELALVDFAIEKLSKEGFIPIFPPVLIKQDLTQGLGYWQVGGNENYYLVNDYDGVGNLYLVGTAEHAIVPMHKDEILLSKNLPLKYVGFSSAFRREAGSYGKDTKGILRVHQFDKVEMIAFVRPEDDEKERKKLLFLAESFMQDLNLPYQLVRLASGDMSFPSAETIDIETWIPSQNKYRETHSISTTTDFQARRLNIKYQDGNEKKFVNILNGTALAIGRTIIAILENYQQEDGSIIIPKVLQKYINKEKIISKKQ